MWIMEQHVLAYIESRLHNTTDRLLARVVLISNANMSLKLDRNESGVAKHWLRQVLTHAVTDMHL